MPVTVDDFSRLSQSAWDRVERVRLRTTDAFQLPEIERAEVVEYDLMTPEQHGELLKRVGPEQYQQYANEMERLRLKHGG